MHRKRIAVPPERPPAPAIERPDQGNGEGTGGPLLQAAAIVSERVPQGVRG